MPKKKANVRKKYLDKITDKKSKRIKVLNIKLLRSYLGDSCILSNIVDTDLLAYRCLIMQSCILKLVTMQTVKLSTKKILYFK